MFLSNGKELHLIFQPSPKLINTRLNASSSSRVLEVENKRISFLSNSILVVGTAHSNETRAMKFYFTRYGTASLWGQSWVLSSSTAISALVSQFKYLSGHSLFAKEQFLRNYLKPFSKSFTLPIRTILSP